MILTFRDYQSCSVDFNTLGQINESHQYFDAISSVMDKLTFYVKRNAALQSSSLNEAAKRAYSKDIRLNRDEKIGAACIFNEILNQYKQSMEEELSIYEEIINKGSILEEGVEVDIDEFIDSININEGLKDKFKSILKKGEEGFKNVVKNVVDGTKDLTTKGVEVVKAKKDDLVNWAKRMKQEFEEKYNALKELIDGIVKKGIDSIHNFINYVLDVFSRLGDKLVEVVKKLGGLKMDKDEKPVSLDDVDTEELYKDMEDDGEKSFFNNVVLRVKAILAKDDENAVKLMTESYLEESIVDNKFIAWLAGYKKDGTKMSVWKTILIGLCASVTVYFLPKVLVIAGLGGTLAIFISSFVALLWNTTGLLRLIYRRNKEKKPGEKFFDWKTGIFFCLSCVSIYFSASAFLKSVGPLLAEICNKMGWTGGEDMSKFGEFIYKAARKFNPKDCFKEGGITEISEEIKNYGADIRGNDLLKSKDDLINTLKDMPGASDAQVAETDKFMTAILNSKGSSGVYAAADAFKDSKDLPLIGLIDTSKWGGSGPIRQAIDFFQKNGDLPDSATLFTTGSTATQAASGGVYGFCTGMTGMTNDQMTMVLNKAAEFAGKDASTIQLHLFGAGEIAQTATAIETVKGAFDVLTPDVPILPMVFPFFDKKKWGKYKITISSETRGAASYMVDEVKMISNKDVKEIQNSSKALTKLISLHDKTWEECKSLSSDEKEEKEVEEPQYIAFYSSLEKTNNPKDKPEENKDEKDEKVTGIAVIFDTLTMMGADVCNFGDSSSKIRARSNPYFIKGLLARLSFRPNEKGDNDTKDYIRKTLGMTLKTLITQNTLYGPGKKYIDSKVEKDKAEFTLRKTVLGDDKKTFPKDKELPEIGFFSPNELISCLNDNSQNNTVAYNFLDGKFDSVVSFTTSKKSGIKLHATKSENSIELRKYYMISKENYADIREEYNKKLKKYKEDPEKYPKPKPLGITKSIDGKYYKKVSKNLDSDPRFAHILKKKKVYDYADVKIIPHLKKGTDLYKELIKDENIKKLLYTDKDGNEGELNMAAIEVLREFLYRPERTFARDDEHDLTAKLNEKGINGIRISWIKNLFKDEQQLHDTFKDAIEIIWDYLLDGRRDTFKDLDNNPRSKKKIKEEYSSLFDEMIEEDFETEYDEELEYEFDIRLLKETKDILSFEDYILERY